MDWGGGAAVVRVEETGKSEFTEMIVLPYILFPNPSK